MAAALVALSGGGCSVGAGDGSPARAGPAAASRLARARATHDAASRLARAQATHEYPSPPPPAESVRDASPSPARAIRNFAGAYINWSWQTVAGDMGPRAGWVIRVLALLCFVAAVVLNAVSK